MIRFLKAVVVTAGVIASPMMALGQTKGPATTLRPATTNAIRPTQTTQTPTRPTQTTTTSPTVHGNSASSNNKTQTLYAIFKTDTTTGRTSTYKFGVSGSPNRSGSTLSQPRTVLAETRDYSNRAVQQTNALARSPTATANGKYSFSSRVLERIPPQPPGAPTARQVVLAKEREAVTKFYEKNGKQMPLGNQLPTPTKK